MDRGVGGQGSLCMGNKENSEVAVTNCTKRQREREEGEKCKRCFKKPAAACDGQMRSER